MNVLKRYWRDLAALLIAVVSLAGLWVMFSAEGSIWLVKFVNGKPQELLEPVAILTQYNKVILPNLQKYSWAIGLTLFAVSVSYILLGSQDEIYTALDEPNSKK
ncbi:hypothetical protein [Vampirovibrio sp.]|uniref:hypothetical protein n=1 Tax=Vampirovibrio sp. TaxID=2717857 RepID=UPI00359420B1